MEAPRAYGLEVQPDGRKKFIYAASFAHYLEQIAELFALFGGTPQVECIAHADTGMYKAHVYQCAGAARKDLAVNYYAYNVRLRNHRDIMGPIYIFQRSHEPLPVEQVEGSAQRMFQMVADGAAASAFNRSVDDLPVSQLRNPERLPAEHERLVDEELRRMRDPELRQKEQEWRDAANSESPSAAAARPGSVKPASDDSVWFRRDADPTAPQAGRGWAPHAPTSPTFPGPIPPFTPGKPRSPSEFKLPPPKNVCTTPANHSSDYTPFGGLGAPPRQQYNGVDPGFARDGVRNEPWATM